MEFSPLVWTTVVFTNSLYVVFMYWLQAMDKSLPPRGSYIPGTKQPFLYVQDFHSCTWGDLIGLPLIMNAFVHLVAGGYITNHAGWQQIQWAIFVLIVIVDGLGFLLMCLGKGHKPDQGFPEIGKVSWHGLSHLPYHGVGVAMSVFSIYHAVIGNLRGPVLYVALLGAVIYIASFVTDMKVGNFDPLKLVEDDCDCPKPCESCRCHRQQ